MSFGHHCSCKQKGVSISTAEQSGLLQLPSVKHVQLSSKRAAYSELAQLLSKFELTPLNLRLSKFSSPFNVYSYQRIQSLHKQGPQDFTSCKKVHCSYIAFVS